MFDFGVFSLVTFFGQAKKVTNSKKEDIFVPILDMSDMLCRIMFFEMMTRGNVHSSAASAIARTFCGGTLGRRASWLGLTIKFGPSNSFTRRTSAFTSSGEA